MLKKLSNFTPILVAIFTVTGLYAANADRIGWGQIVAPLVFAICVAGLFMLLFWLLKWTSRSMPFIASIFTGAALLWYLITPWAGLALMLMALVLGIWKRVNTKLVANILAVVFIIAIIVSTGQAIFINATNQVAAQKTEIKLAAPGTPNIYFIIPDRMPSIAAMQESGIPTEDFVAVLKERGFYVKENQLSADQYYAGHPQNVHTTRTMRYMASVLNDGKEIPLDISYKDCSSEIKNPNVFNELHDKGYTICNVASWFAETSQLPTADYNYRFTDVSFMEKIFQDELSVAFYDRTIIRGLNFRLLQSSYSTGNVERERHIWQAGEVIKLSKVIGGPVFVMAHLMLPHEPFVWDADGNPQNNKRLSEPEAYYQQIQYAQSYLLNLIYGIQANDPNAIIIIQADEGMAYKSPVELNTALSSTQWSGVLTAWYIPGADASELSNLKHTEILKYILGSR